MFSAEILLLPKQCALASDSEDRSLVAYANSVETLMSGKTITKSQTKSLPDPLYAWRKLWRKWSELIWNLSNTLTHKYTGHKAGKATLYCPTPDLDQGSFDNSGFSPKWTFILDLQNPH